MNFGTFKNQTTQLYTKEIEIFKHNESMYWL